MLCRQRETGTQAAAPAQKGKCTGVQDKVSAAPFSHLSPVGSQSSLHFCTIIPPFFQPVAASLSSQPEQPCQHVPTPPWVTFIHSAFRGPVAPVDGVLTSHLPLPTRNLPLDQLLGGIREEGWLLPFWAWVLCLSLLIFGNLKIMFLSQNSYHTQSSCSNKSAHSRGLKPCFQLYPSAYHIVCA